MTKYVATLPNGETSIRRTTTKQYACAVAITIDGPARVAALHKLAAEAPTDEVRASYTQDADRLAARIAQHGDTLYDVWRFTERRDSADKYAASLTRQGGRPVIVPCVEA